MTIQVDPGQPMTARGLSEEEAMSAHLARRMFVLGAVLVGGFVCGVLLVGVVQGGEVPEPACSNTRCVDPETCSYSKGIECWFEIPPGGGGCTMTWCANQ